MKKIILMTLLMTGTIHAVVCCGQQDCIPDCPSGGPEIKLVQYEKST